MGLTTSLHGRLRNTVLPKTHGLLPLFEAVVNAVQSLDDLSQHSDQHSVRVDIIRSGQGAIEMGGGDGLHPDQITEFVITDTGAGFHQENMRSFETLDSEYKSKLGCRGVGRLLWLKAFDRVYVESDFRDEDGMIKRRTFRFSADEGVSDNVVTPSNSSAAGTRVRLVGFKRIYQENARKRSAIIGRDLMEHCLWYFVRPGGSPPIEVVDGNERIDLRRTFDDYMLASSQIQHFTVKDQRFDLVHLRLRANSRASHMLAWCAADRVVTEEPLTGKIAGLFGRLDNKGEEFLYAAFLTSKYLDEHVRSERTAFDIPEDAEGTLGEDTDVTLSEVRQQVLVSAESYLAGVLEVTRTAGRKRIENFVDTKAPRYKPILAHIMTDRVRADPGVSDRELELQLHRGQADWEANLLVEGQQVLHEEVHGLDPEQQTRLNDYLSKVEDAKKSDLAAYVSRRKVILELLAKAISRNENGNYQREEAVHQLIMPLRTTSNDATFDAANLWLLDERLAFHNYLASDKSLSAMPITGSNNRGEPDLLALKLLDEPYLVAEGSTMPLASIVIVELKRPMRRNVNEGQDKNPISQVLSYLDRVREGQVMTRQGRPIPASDRVPGFCYVIADLTPTMRERCKQAELTPTQDGLGYFGYKKNYEAYVEVIGFDRLLNAANERNRAFFDKLGLPST